MIHIHRHKHRSTGRYWLVLLAAQASATLALAQNANTPPQSVDDDEFIFCETDTEVQLRGGGMVGNGWDGPGQNPATVFWHVEAQTPDMVGDQRTALIAAMQAYASVVRITFRELPVANRNVQVDWNFTTGDHCAVESAECGDADCPFDGAGGILAHAGFPPGVNSTCVNPMPETYSGNVHFDEAETWELDNVLGAGPYSLRYVAVHELGHSIGLVHSGQAGDVMFPSLNSSTTFSGLSANDIANIRSGYATGVGSVITLNQTGIWVDGAFGGTELGTIGNPFDTVIEGVNAVPPYSTNVVVHIDAGTYPETMFIADSMFLQAENGSVLIGG